MSTSFTEHSYRTFAADGTRGELILFQNVGYERAEWAFRDRNGLWSNSGRLNWPIDRDYEPNRPIRLAYPNVLLDGRSLYFFGKGNIVEPNEAWRRFKRESTGKTWDFVARRLFFSWTPDITSQEFSDWLEIANREETAGRIALGDLWRAPDGLVYIVWEETALDMRLRSKFFPNEKQRWELNHAVLRAGKIVARHTLVAVDEGISAPIAHLPRFHITPEGRLFVFFYMNGTDSTGKLISENRLLEINRDGPVGQPIKVPLVTPLNIYMTSTIRAGSNPSTYLDLIGTAPGKPNTVRYARVRLES